MASEQKIRETVIWLAGLLSTDGGVYRYKKQWLSYLIFSAEREWLEQIADRLSEVGIDTNIYAIKRKSGKGSINDHRLRVNMPHQITQLLKNYAQGFMMQRKWKRVISAYPNGVRNQRFWTSEENQLLIENHSKMCPREIAKNLNRTVNSVQRQIYRLRKKHLISPS